MSDNHSRIVITGLGQISPLGNNIADLSIALDNQQSGVRTLESIPYKHLKASYGGEARDFTGEISNYGVLEKTLTRAIKKATRLMCREIQMGVAAAQHAMQNAQLTPEIYNPDRIGIVFGCDYILSLPHEFREGVMQCLDEDGEFDFDQWAENGLPKVNPLWLLKYLPNMPSSHIAIYNDLRGPSNSITMRESSANQALAEAYCTIERGDADIMVSGATGTRIHPLRTVHVNMQEELVGNNFAAAAACRPYENTRDGMVIGEGAGSMIVERLSHAEARGATIYGEIVGFASSTCMNRDRTARFDQAFENVIKQSLANANLQPEDIGHIHGHGMSTINADRGEAVAINKIFGNQTPVVAAKSYMGNLGAGSGSVEMISSLLALDKGTLFKTLNYDTPDPLCDIQVTNSIDIPAGDSFINLNASPQGQASAVIIKSLQ
ncbi:MAG: beta-ketoacyl-[acyl-carrier-protein] synthase family protein [Planctomycetaceae bacterium]|nr:beta-ketoacyl-[acyl-carrier-protein] synthase family protein [Planctomycetaceae bacterium]